MTTLDAPTLKQLRECEEWITIRATWRSQKLTQSQILGKRRDAAGENYTHLIIDVPSWLEYGSELTRRHEHLHAYASVMTPRFHSYWQTFLHLARPGDELKIVWSANGHANTHIRDAGLNVDHCDIQILRPVGKSGRTATLQFHIAMTIAPSNTARMFTASDASDQHFIGVDGPGSAD